MSDHLNKSEQIDDCWNRIGIWSTADARCEKLANYIHCNNCEIFAKSGRRLFDRAGDQKYLEAWAEEISSSIKEGARKTISILVFRIGDEWYGLPTQIFQEIVDMRLAHSLPNARGNILKGIINVRGELCVYISLGWLIGAARGKAGRLNETKHRLSRVAIIKNDSYKYAFPVSEIFGVKRYSISDVSSVPATAANSPANYMAHMLTVNNMHIGCLDQGLIFKAIESAIK